MKFINNKDINSLMDEYPTIEYKIKVISKFPNDVIKDITSTGNYSFITQSIEKFINSILPGDTLIFEYPCWYNNSGYGSGLHIFSIVVSNIRTGKTISIRAPKLQYIYRCLEEYEIL